jgi:hypothetical protein
MQPQENRDVAFDLLLTLAEFTFKQNLPKTSLRIEAALDEFLRETEREEQRPARVSRY